MYRRKVYEVIGDYNPAWQYVEDYDYWLRVRKQFKLARLPNVHPYTWGIHQQSLTSKLGPRQKALAARVRMSHASPWKKKWRIFAETREEIGESWAEQGNCGGALVAGLQLVLVEPWRVRRWVRAVQIFRFALSRRKRHLADVKHESELSFWQGWISEHGVEADAEYYRRFMLAMGNLEDTSLFEGKICLDIGCGPKGRLRRSANLPMTNPTVSVVMSVFNGEPYLHEALESILNQTFRDFEFIIINDGSTDGSATVLESYRKSDSRLRVYHQENRGVGESLNRGCGLAQGKYIARMDADDIATSGRLMRQVEFMEGHPEVDVVGGAVEFIDATGKS
jgi:hypothetical protein